VYVEKIMGPPGTGKTETLIRRVEEELAAGMEPSRLGYFSFTKAAALEAWRRAMDAFPDYEREDFIHLRTLHSEAFQQLGWTRDKVMTGKPLRDFSRAFGYELSEAGDPDVDLEEHEVQEMVLKTLGDFLLFFTNWRTNLMLEFEPAYRAFWELYREALPYGWAPGVVRLFEERYREHKAAEGLLDFNDMLARVMEKDLRPALDVLIFDEAQDSGPLQYKVLDHWLEGVERHYIGGDPDQCLYQWMGTDPSLLMGRPCDKETILVQSYRVPRAVHRLAVKIICTTEYRPRPASGEVRELPLTEVLNRFASLDGYTGFILVRNLFLLADLIEELYQWGIPFENLRGPSPFKGKTAAKILVIRRLFRGEPVRVEDLWRFISKISQKQYFKRGPKAQIQSMSREKVQLSISLSDIRVDCSDSFLRDPLGALGISPLTRAYFDRVLERYGEGALLEAPPVTIGTIHSVKGLEADWVAIYLDMSKKTWLSWQNLPREEERAEDVEAGRPIKRDDGFFFRMKDAVDYLVKHHRINVDPGELYRVTKAAGGGAQSIRLGKVSRLWYLPIKKDEEDTEAAADSHADHYAWSGDSGAAREMEALLGKVGSGSEK